MKRIFLSILLVLLFALPSNSAVYDDAIADWRQSGTTDNERRADSSTNGYDATIAGTTPLTSTVDHDSNANSAVDYNGTDQYMTVDAAAIQNITTGDVSGTSWIMYDTTVYTDIFWTIPFTSGLVYKFALAGGFNTGNLDFTINTTEGGTETHTIEIAANLSPDVYYNVTWVKDGASLKIWLDNVLEIDVTLGGTTLVAGLETNIGVSFTAFPFYHTGPIDRVSFWDRALTTDDVEEIYTGIIPNAITINEPAIDGIVNPYDSNGQFSQLLTGTYAGTLTNPIVRVLRKSDDQPVLVNGNLSNTLTGQSVAGGVWSGTLSGIPKGFYYYFEISKSNDPPIIDVTSNNYGVGYLMGEGGQSNPFRMGTEGTGTPSDQTRKFNGTAWVTVTGLGDTNMLNQISSDLGCVAGVVNYSVGGAALMEKNDLGPLFLWWSNAVNPSDNYDTFLAWVTAASGGVLNGFIWWQDETDCIGDITGYKAAEIAFMTDQIRTDITYSGTGVLPSFVMLHGRWTNSGFTVTDADWTQTSDWKTENFNEGLFQGIGTVIDFAESVPGHISGTNYTQAGLRIARWAGYQEGIFTDYQSPTANTISRVSNLLTNVNMGLYYGDTITGGDGFDVNIGTLITPNWIAASGAVLNATTIQLTHTTGTVVEARYMYGSFDATAPTGSITRDNSALSLPVLQSGSIPLLIIQENPAMLMMLFRQSYTPSVGGGGTVTYGSTGVSSAVVGNTTLTLAPPAGISDGEFLGAVVFDDTDQPLTGLDGFTLITSQTSSSSRMSVLKKIASSESGSYAFSSAGSSDKGGFVFRCSKTSGTFSTSVFSSTFVESPTTTISSTAVDVPANSMLLIAYGSDDTIALLSDPADGTMTEIEGTALVSGRMAGWYEDYISLENSVTESVTPNTGADQSIISVVIEAI